ncbi:MAG: hypothetical protein ACOC1X_03080 [Promethearchaeota archaeon]
MKDIFKPALETISDKDSAIFGPVSFRDYLKDSLEKRLRSNRYKKGRN